MEVSMPTDRLAEIRRKYKKWLGVIMWEREEIGVLLTLLDEQEIDITALTARVAVYRAVLEGLELQDLDKLQEKTPELAKVLGGYMAHEIKRLKVEYAQSQAEATRMATILRLFADRDNWHAEDDEHLSMWRPRDEDPWDIAQAALKNLTP